MSTRHVLRLVLGLSIGLLGHPGVAGGQEAESRVGADVGVDRETVEYVRRSYRRISDVLGEWAATWERGAIGEMGEFYSNRAVVHFPAGARTARGRQDIVRKASSGLPVVEEASLQVADFDLNNRLAFVFGYFSYRTAGGTPDGVEQVKGTFLATLHRDGRQWKLRTHLFRPSNR